jgi:predicted nucleotidyltransferase
MSDTVLSRDISREALIAELRALRPAFERRGVEHMALFGSRARGDNRPDSDVDLAIEVDNARRFSLIDLSGVNLLVEDKLRLDADVKMLRSFQSDIRRHFERDRVVIF